MQTGKGREDESRNTGTARPELQHQESTDTTSIPPPYSPSSSSSHTPAQAQAQAQTQDPQNPPRYSSTTAASSYPALYTKLPSQPTSTRPQQAGTSLKSLQAILGEPIPPDPKRSLKDKLLFRRPGYDRSFPDEAEPRGKESEAVWNVWGSRISAPKER